ncbi:RepB family plasmid replication initiator protein [Ralstonia solanacearum]|uniref:replication initiation protein n=1 Tax=Ralstonia solanacearum TaxID=305 RepID=UPI0005C4865A|nr:RepB family plasmid replication initiator protein [Ralstonia solanacearum]MDB0543943.1 RepB family plasmid replication initiator protein [Ralstonia solanacearum]MDB0553793.1 RepB family plasmid replication initiator protein [Ralstonia solanacearum]MDB0558881.1 RepB family plasmid replication initiator protein [Ralstonia solanacearum]
MAQASDAKKGSQIALFQQPEVPEPFKKAVQAIHVSPVSGALTLQQRRMFNALIKNAIDQRRTQSAADPYTFQVRVPDVMMSLGLSTKDTAYIKDTAKSLMRTVVDWDQLNSDGTATWTGSTLVAGVKIIGSVMNYSFAPQICDELLNPELYALIDMRVAKLFRRAYSLALWENTVRFERIGMTARMPLKTFRHLILGRDEGETKYAEYKALKRSVINPSIAEINKRSDHTIELIEHKVGRNVVEVQFKIERKPENATTEEPNLELVMAVIKFGVPQTEAKRLVRTYGADRVQRAMNYTRARQKKKDAAPIGNAAAFFRRALAEDWGKGQAAAEPATEIRTEATGGRAAPKSEQEARERYLVQQTAQAQDYWAELSPDEQSGMLARYNDQCEVKNLKIVSGKKPSKAAETTFFRWIALETWGEPSVSDILDFVLTGKV